MHTSLILTNLLFFESTYYIPLSSIVTFVYYPPLSQEDSPLTSCFDRDTYLLRCHPVGNSQCLYMACTPAYNLNTHSLAALDNTPSICYYLYTTSGQLDKLRCVLINKAGQSLATDELKYLGELAHSHFNLSEAQSTQLIETLSALPTQVVTSKSQLINQIHCDYKNTKITLPSHSKIESCLEITLYK